jgi:hypothetical protein
MTLVTICTVIQQYFQTCILLSKLRLTSSALPSIASCVYKVHRKEIYEYEYLAHDLK